MHKMLLTGEANAVLGGSLIFIGLINGGLGIYRLFFAVAEHSRINCLILFPIRKDDNKPKLIS